MFDIGFWELTIIGLVALLVIGPEKLPKFAYDAGRVVRKLRGFVHTTKEEVKKGLEVERVEHLNDDISRLDTLIKDTSERFKRGKPPSKKF